MKITFENGETYTEKEFQRDIVRMFDSLRTREIDSESRCCCAFIKCKTCPLYDICNRREGFKYSSFETIEKVYKWAKEHPYRTNEDYILETMGIELGLLTNDEIIEWLDEEYKEPKDESEE